MGFGQAGAKRCGGCLIHQLSSIGVGDASHKRGTLFIGKTGSHYAILLSCETSSQVLLGIYCKKVYWIPLFTKLLLFYVFKFDKAKSATQSVLMILTMNGLFQKNFNVFYFTPKKYISLALHPFPLLFFSIIVFILWFLTAAILLIQAPLPIQSHKNALLRLKIHIWMEFFWNQKFLLFHKRNFNPKFINYF